jgi:exodeoxyribonuclease VII large subunit
VVSAIGHEVDVTLSDLAADVRAPTPSAAAELVVPDRKVILIGLGELRLRMRSALHAQIARAREEIDDLRDRLRPQRFVRRLDEKKQGMADLSDRLSRAFANRIGRDRLLLAEIRTALEGTSPLAVLARGYCIAEKDGKTVKSARELSREDHLRIRFTDGKSHVLVERVEHD